MPSHPVYEPTAAAPVRTRRRRALPHLVVGGLVTVAVLVALVALRYEQDQAANAERERATRAALALQTALELRSGRLDGLHGLFASASEVTPGEFARYARARGLVRSGLASVSWNERVRAEDRPAWERRNGRPILEVGAAGPRPAAERVDLFPVTYVVGRPPAGAARGVDVSYDADRRDALRAARDSLSGEQATRPRRPTAARPGAGFEIYRPVYRPGLPTSTVLERREALVGFVVGAFRAEALGAELPARVQVRDGARTLVGPTAPMAAGASQDVQVGRRTWSVTAAGPGPALLLPAAALLGGLALTALAGAIFVVLGRRERYAYALVERRLDERRRAEAALGRSEARYRALVEASPEAIVVADEGGTIVDANPGARALLDRDGAALAGRPLSALVHPRDRRRLAACLAGGGATEVALRRADGTEVPAELTAASWDTGDGRLFSAVLRDVSERRRREEETRRQRDYANSLIASIQDGLVVHAPDGTITRVNDRFCEMTGFGRARLVGARPPLPFWPSGAGGDLARMLARPEEAAGEELDTVFLRDDGERFPVIVTSATLRDPRGASAGSVWTVKDVTARRRAEAARGASEEKFRLLAEYSTDLVGRHALDGTILYHSPSCHALLGYPPERLVGRSPYEFCHPEDVARLRLMHADALARTGGSIGSYRFLRRDGTWIWLEKTTRIIRDERTGELIEMHTASRDVTERRRLEAERTGEQRFLETMLDALSDGVAAFDRHGEPVVVNRAARELCGLPDGLLGREAVNAVLRGDPVEGAFAGPVRDVELVLERPDGEGRSVLVSGQPIRGPGGEPAGAVVALHDVTARRRAEEALFEARERFENAFENAPVGIALIDAAPAGNGRLLHVNQALCTITGYAAAELRGRRLGDLALPGSGGAWTDGLARLAAGEVAQLSTEHRLARADGAAVWARLDASLVRDAAGRPLYAIGQVQDVSERRALDRMKDDFVAVASHELRTPLTSVLGYLALVLEGDAGALGPEQRRYLSVAESSAERLLRLADDLLLVARSDAGRLDVELEELDLGAVVAASVHAARPLAEERGIALALAASPLPIMLGDRTRLGQVVDNLLANALKFTPEGGRVGVDVRPWAEGAALEVSDTGIGIPVEEQGRLFERFFRTSDASRRAIAGTGLGLAISKMIVEAHGGSISVDSAAGRGAVFRVELPRAAARRGAPGHARRARPMPSSAPMDQ